MPRRGSRHHWRDENDQRRIKRNQDGRDGKGEETTFTISDCATRTSSTCFHNYDLPRDPYRNPRRVAALSRRGTPHEARDRRGKRIASASLVFPRLADADSLRLTSNTQLQFSTLIAEWKGPTLAVEAGIALWLIDVDVRRESWRGELKF